MWAEQATFKIPAQTIIHLSVTKFIVALGPIQVLSNGQQRFAQCIKQAECEVAHSSHSSCTV
jgi:hypothetical protein